MLEHRLKELMRENACMRDAMLNRVDEGRLAQLTQAHRKHHELMAASQTAKERAEGKARSTQERVRALQVRSTHGIDYCAHHTVVSAER